jgi:predicted MFS family arabinose efflux permease
MFAAALLGPRIAGRRSPKIVARTGLGALSVGAVILVATIDPTLNETAFSLGLGVFGIGVGLLASQLGNVIMSSVDPGQTNQAGGLQGTAQNLGASLGTALIGSILIGAMTTSFATYITTNPDVPPEAATAIAQAATDSGLEVVAPDSVAPLLVEAGVPSAQAESIADDYAAAQMYGLRVALGAIALLAVLSLWFTRNLPSRSDRDRAPVHEAVAAPA